MDVDVADVAGGRGSTSMRTRADLGGSLSAATSRGSNRPVKVSGCFGRLLAYDEFPASDLVTSCWLSERALYRWRLAMLLYISWATGMEVGARPRLVPRLTGWIMGFRCVDVQLLRAQQIVRVVVAVALRLL